MPDDTEHPEYREYLDKETLPSGIEIREEGAAPPIPSHLLWPQRLRSIGEMAKNLSAPITVCALLAIGYWIYSDHFNIFALAVGVRGERLLEGSAGTVALLLVERFVLKLPISKGWYAAVIAGFLFVGCFQAWEQEYLSRVQRERDLGAANGDKAKWQALASLYQSAIPNTREPLDSLRRRTKSLADDIDQFLEERKEGHPPYTNGQAGAAGEQSDVNKKSDAYDTETGRLCLSQFGTKILGIPKELAAKGLPVRWLNVFQANDNLRCLSGGDFPGSETDILRGLAYRLDARDMPVQF